MNNVNKEYEKLWLKNYDSHVNKRIKYEDFTLNDLLYRAQNDYREKIFLSYLSEEFTFESVYKLITSLAKKMQILGVRKGDRVAIILPNIPQFVIAYYAVLKLGGIVVAMNPRYTKSEMEYLFLESEVSYVFCISSRASDVREIGKSYPIKTLITTEIDDYKKLKLPRKSRKQDIQEYQEMQFLELIENSKTETSLKEYAVFPDDPAIFQFSGGTTGEPKAAIGLHKNITANVSQFEKWCDLKHGQEVILAAIPLYHVYGMVLAMNLGIAIGAQIILISDPTDVNYILDQINDKKVTFYPGVPTMYYAITKNERIISKQVRIDSIKACISGSFSLHPQIKKEFEELTNGILVEGYGLSEAPTATHCNPLYGINKTGSIGLPLPDVDARIVDIEEGTKVLEQGQIGELVIRGPQVMAGYYKKPDETSTAIQDGWLFTGDIAWMDKGGYFFLVDRKKSLIKVNGLQVWPNEIEKVLNDHQFIMESAVGGISDLIQGERVIAWVVENEIGQLTDNEIVEWCKEKLSGYKIPSEIIRIDKIPRTGVGKILHRKLIKEYIEKKEA